MKILPFRNWRPLTAEERANVPRAFHWLTVPRLRRKPQPKEAQADADDLECRRLALLEKISGRLHDEPSEEEQVPPAGEPRKR
jgi:hypothetical protein